MTDSHNAIPGYRNQHTVPCVTCWDTWIGAGPGSVVTLHPVRMPRRMSNLKAIKEYQERTK